MSFATATAAACWWCLSALAAQRADDRINRIEHALVLKPIQISGEPMAVDSLAHMMGDQPGLSVAVIDEGRIAWAKAYGVSDSRTRTPVTTDTLFSAGGISKAVTAVAVLRLVDKGVLD